MEQEFDELLMEQMEEECGREQIYFVPRDTSEWHHMWCCLALHYSNLGQEKPTVCYNPEYMEVWQYMGTIRRSHLLFHEFRHRMHPGSGRREYLRLRASDRLAVLGGRLVECG